jgi:hypothetical protein
VGAGIVDNKVHNVRGLRVCKIHNSDRYLSVTARQRVGIVSITGQELLNLARALNTTQVTNVGSNTRLNLIFFNVPRIHPEEMIVF